MKKKKNFTNKKNQLSKNNSPEIKLCTEFIKLVRIIIIKNKT